MKRILLSNHYNFRAVKETKKSLRAKHLFTLREMQPYMFEGIHIGSLKHDPEAINTLTAACETVALAKELHDMHVLFYMAIGENHAWQAFALHHIVTTNGLPKAGVPFDLSLEHNEKRMKERILPKATNNETVLQYFDDNNLVLKQLLDARFKYTPYKSHLRAHHYISLAQNGTRVFLTDAPRIPDETDSSVDLLDETDPLVKSLIEKRRQEMCGGRNPVAREHEFNRINTCSPIGVSIRNEYALEKLPTNNNVVHICGNAHIWNKELPANGTAYSLVVYAQEKGFVPIGRVLLQNKRYQIPQLDEYDSNIYSAQPIVNINKPTRITDKQDVKTKMKLLGLGHLVPASMAERLNRNKAELEKHKIEIGKILSQESAIEPDAIPA